MRKSLRKEKLTLNNYVIAEELHEAKVLWIKQNQIELKRKGDYKELKKNLSLREDEEGVIRSYGRYKHANIPFDNKAPIMLNRDHRLAEIIVNYCHSKVLHRGVKQTLTELRSKYWITKGRSFVKKILRPCTICKRYNARPFHYPEHSDLPSFRFEGSNPFRTTGVDYLGPLFCSPVFGEDDSLYKTWVVIYTCASSRAFVLDVVHNGQSQSFINSLSRFISRRGCPSTILSDNGSVFTADDT